jgi:hypothetical protein
MSMFFVLVLRKSNDAADLDPDHLDDGVTPINKYDQSKIQTSFMDFEVFFLFKLLSFIYLINVFFNWIGK